MDIFEHDELLREKGFSIIAGIDEAGRGTLAGPVVAAAVVLRKGERIDRLRDSKKVPAKEREYLFNKIQNASIDIGIGIVGSEEIDRMNILRATKLAMQQAVGNLSMKPDLLVIDAVPLATMPIKQLSPIKGEYKSASVAAASIVAKYVRDNIMRDLHLQYPDYNFEKHKGYSTKEHLEKLKIYGPCAIHRKSFHRVMSLELPLSPS
jgi:ribonuclease HII